MADRTTRLRVVGDTTDAQNKLRTFGQQIETFRDKLSTGLGIDIANRMMTYAERAFRVLTGAVRTGVGFNSVLENTNVALAGILQSIAPDSFNGFNDALNTSRALVKVLREEAKMTTATFKDLVESAQGLAGPALSGGVPLQKVPSLVSMVSRAVQGAMPGAPSYQILQEGRAMLTGQIGPDAQLARMLGITNPMIKQVKEQGRLYEFLEERLKGFNQAAEASMGTLTGLKSNLEDLVTMGLAEAMEGTSEQLKSFVKDLQQFAKDPEFKVASKTLGEIAMNIVKIGGWLGKTVAGVFDEVQTLVQIVGSPLSMAVASWNGASPADASRIAMETVTDALDEYNQRIDDAKKQDTAGSKTDPLLNRSIKLAAQEELDKAAAARAKTADTWFKSLAGGVQRMRVEPAQGLYYTSGGSAAARETLGVQRKMLDALVRIHERLARGVKVDLDALAI